MFKKIAYVTATASIVLSLALPAFAAVRSGTPDTNAPSGMTQQGASDTTHTKKTDAKPKSAAMTACLKTASDSRKTALRAANDTYAAAIKAAADARKSALAAAKALTDKTAKKQAVQDAYKAWRDARQAAKTDLKSAKKAAADQLKTDRAACKNA
jgi:hypothetical protein